jgi:hypothetical protein
MLMQRNGEKCLTMMTTAKAHMLCLIVSTSILADW